MLQDFSAHVVALMSVTMWVHFNDGDDSLHSLLLQATQLTSKWLILEPQPYLELLPYCSLREELLRKATQVFPCTPVSISRVLSCWHTWLKWWQMSVACGKWVRASQAHGEEPQAYMRRSRLCGKMLTIYMYSFFCYKQYLSVI
jgi:hypothetical protein